MPAPVQTSTPDGVMVARNLGYTVIPTNAVAAPQVVVALTVAGPHGPEPPCPCHRMVTDVVPCPETIAPRLAGEILQVTVVPEGMLPPDNVSAPVPSTHTLVGPDTAPTVAALTVMVPAAIMQKGAVLCFKTTVIVPDSEPQITCTLSPVVLGSAPGSNPP